MSQSAAFNPRTERDSLVYILVVKSYFLTKPIHV
jgi:hypothetical protein